MTLISPDNNFALMAALFLFKANLRHMLFETTRMTIAFLAASIGTIIGVIIAVGLLEHQALAAAADTDPAIFHLWGLF